MRTTIEMAREAAGDDWKLFQEFMPEIHRLVELVRADEREKRDEAVELLNTIHMGNESARSQDIIWAAIRVLRRNAPEELAAIIRARSNT
jgi:uncharacterized protein YpbB